MVLIQPDERELSLKLVYYGPPLSGKTTNLRTLQRALRPESRGRLMTLDAADERTLFFDLLPTSFVTASGVTVKIKLYSVPGQVMHHATRRIVLEDADGVVFVADGQRGESVANQQAWIAMQDFLREHRLDQQGIPVVVQFNKLDLPHVRSADELESLRHQSESPIFEAVAIRGQGVVEPLLACLRLAFRNLLSREDAPRAWGLTEEDLLRAVAGQLDLAALAALNSEVHAAPQSEGGA